MGRIKTALIKRTARKLLAEENAFDESFEHAKKILGSNTMPSKTLRNRIAGYIARLKKIEKSPKKIKSISQEQPLELSPAAEE